MLKMIWSRYVLIWIHLGLLCLVVQRGNSFVFHKVWKRSFPVGHYSVVRNGNLLQEVGTDTHFSAVSTKRKESIITLSSQSAGIVEDYQDRKSSNSEQEDEDEEGNYNDEDDDDDDDDDMGYDVEEALSDLCLWANENKIIKSSEDGCKVLPGISDIENAGRGLFASTDIKKNDVILSIPLEICLSLDSFKNTPLEKLLGSSKFNPRSGDAAYIATQLLYEFGLGEKSKYQGWLQSLPGPSTSFDHVLFWSDEEIKVLTLSSTRNMIALIEGVEEDYETFKNSIFDRIEEVGVKLNPNLFSLASFKWAIAIVLSRSFYTDGSLKLIPYLDMINTRSDSKMEPVTAGMGIFGGKQIQLIADRDYEVGEEVLCSYGQKSNLEMLEEHGFLVDYSASKGGQEENTNPKEFLTDSNGNDINNNEDTEEKDTIISNRLNMNLNKDTGIKDTVVNMMASQGATFEATDDENKSTQFGKTCELLFELKEGDDPFFDDKEDILLQNNLSLQMCFDLNESGAPSDELMQFLRLYLLKGQDAFLLEAVFRPDVWGFMGLPVSLPNEKNVYDYICKICTSTLAKFDSAETLTTNLQNTGEGRPDRLEKAAGVRNVEKEILIKTLNRLERESTALDLKEYYQERRLKELQLCGPLRDDELNLTGADGGRGGGSNINDLDW